MMYSFFTVIMVLVHFASCNALMPGGMNTPGIGALSANEMADLEALEKELARAAQEIDQYVASLSPEEQEQFNQAVKEVESMLENMSEEEFNSMINQMFQQEMPEEFVAQPEALKPQQTPQEPIKTTALSGDDLRKQETALALIESLINHTNSYVVKTSAIIEVPGSINRWALQGKIGNWPTDATWNSFEQEIARFAQRLHMLLDRDPATNSFRYLLQLIAEEKTYTILETLNNSLVQQEQRIEVPVMSGAKMNIASKNALKYVTSVYSTALYAQEVIKLLDAIIATYEPAAKKLKEEALQRAERAQQEAARPVQAGRTVTAGKPTEVENQYPGMSQNFGPSYPGGYTGGYPGYTPFDGSGSLSGYPESGRDRTPSATDAGGRTPSAAAKPVDTQKQKEEEKRSDATSDRLLGQLEESLSMIQGLFTEYPVLTSLKAHLLSAEPVNTGLGNYGIGALYKYIGNATSQITAIGRQLAGLSKEAQAQYKRETLGLLKIIQPLLDPLKNELVGIKNEWSMLSSKISADKKYVYFKEGSVTEEQKSQTTPIGTEEQKDSTFVDSAPEQNKTSVTKSSVVQEKPVVDVQSLQKQLQQIEEKLIRLETEIEQTRYNQNKTWYGWLGLDRGTYKKKLDSLLAEKRKLELSYQTVYAQLPRTRRQSNPDEPAGAIQLVSSPEFVPTDVIGLGKQNTGSTQGSEQQTKEQNNKEEEPAQQAREGATRGPLVPSNVTLFALLDAVNKLYSALNTFSIQ